MGYRGPTACSAAGITYRQLDYWARTGLVEPSVRAAHGSGSQRLYSFRDILVLKVVKRLLDTGISLQQIRAAVQHLRDRGSADLAQVTLMSDGASPPDHLPGADPATLEALTGAYLARLHERLEIDDDLLARWQAVSAVATRPRQLEGQRRYSDAVFSDRRWSPPLSSFWIART